MKNIMKKCKKNKGYIYGIAAVAAALLLFFVGRNYVFAEDIEPLAIVVSTGVSDGSCIGFFGVEYEDVKGVTRTQYIFPHDGDYKDSYDLINKAGAGLDGKRQKIFKGLGYQYATWSDVANTEALKSYSEDIFIFKPWYKVASIKNVYIYSDLAAGNSKNWNCTGFSIYRVNELYGTKMYGYASDKSYVSFEGDLLACLEGGYADFATASDIVHKLSPSSQQYKLNTTIVPSVKFKAAEDDEYIFKIDFADVYGAGIEAFTNGEKKILSDMQMPEVLNLNIAYKCQDGRRQSVNIPMITSAVGTAMERGEENALLVDFAGQGESIVAVGNLPDFATIESLKLTYGTKNALKQSELIETSNTLRTAKTERINKNNDSISISGITIYKSGYDDSKLTYKRQDETILVPNIEGNPIYYYTADSYRGVEIGIDKTLSFAMKEYTSGVRLKHVDNQRKYLVVIDTSKVSTLASRQTIPELTMKLSYISTSGYEMQTEVYNLSEMAKEYYGYIPNSNNEDCAYELNITAGGQLRVLVSLNDVERFNSVALGVAGQNDEWMMSNFAIYMVDSISTRRGEWIKNGKTFFGQSANITYSRDINGSDVFTESAELFNAPIEMLLQKGENRTVDFTAKNVVEAGSVYDWMAENKYYIEYKNASANYLGFYDAKINYQIDVNVADNSTNTLEDGDSGSKNYFYFQLVFANGTSAVVQANQMLEADGFLTGQTATFNISTNYDYGELVAIRIIPDDFSSKADPYDKLNIESVNVTKKGKSGYATVWTVANVGWIGIDYIDEGGKVNSTSTGRTMEELGYVYNVTGSSTGVELQFAITTGTFDIINESKQFSGSVMADIGYSDANGVYKTVSIDVVQAMYNYANKTASSVAGNNKRLSDPGFMFLENRTNRFTCFINGISELLDIRLHVYSDGGGTLNISSISAALVVEEGPLNINTWGEYEKESTLFPLTKNANKIEPFNVPYEGSVNANITFKSIDKSMLTSLVNGTWPYNVDTEASIGEEYLNVFVYKENTETKETDVNLRVVMDYSDSYGQGFRVQNNLNYKQMSDETGYYRIDRIRVNDLEAIKEIKIEKTSGNGDVALGDIIVQKIRDNQIVQTMQYDMEGKKASLSPTISQTVVSGNTGEQQRVVIAFADDMNVKTIVPRVTDVAVALIYTSIHDPSGTEYISPYVYLSSDGKTSVTGGESGVFNFDIQNLKDVVGISVAATGGMNIKVDLATVASYKVTNNQQNLEKWYSIYCNGEISNNSKRFDVTTSQLETENTIIPIQLVLKTGTQDGQNTGTEAPIRLVINYNGFDNNSYTTEVEDIRKYTVSGDYSTNGVAVVELMLPNMKEINTLTFEPYDYIDSNTEMWKMSEVSVNYGVGEVIKKAQISMADKDAFAYEGTPVRVVLRRILVKLQYKEGDIEKLLQNSTDGCIREVGEQLHLKVTVENSGMEGEIKAYEVIDGIRRDVSDKYLSKTDDSSELIFSVPNGSIVEDAKFEIVASSKEMPEFESVLSVTVKVP
ncbi:MAG: hypothetical protein UF228_07100 [Lachnospiraceae bacterium]|nr:hypothetical protein [Lachnospiraceae bacterium]